VSAEPAPPPLDSENARDANWLGGELDSGKVQLTWVPATVLADRPGKMASETSPDEEVRIANDLATLMLSATQELIVISPYFVPAAMGSRCSPSSRAKACTSGYSPIHWRRRFALVHNGYARYRVQLLKLGIELSEVRPKLGQKRARFHPFRSSNASLHAKALVIDQKTVFIGSMNMDARSARTNSETGTRDTQR